VADDQRWSWETASSAVEVHDLLCACDEYQAMAYGIPAPRRSVESSRRRVHSGSVQLLRVDRDPVAMFTLSWEPTFDADLSIFPAAERPAYLARLAVAPEWLRSGSLAGAQCLRRAIALASSQGADALRSEANPDLLGPRTLLDLLGFVECGQGRRPETGLRRVYLQRAIGRK
jgi:hypothetical protein